MHGEAGVVGFSRTDRRMHVSASTIFENTDFEMFLSLSLFDFSLTLCMSDAAFKTGIRYLGPVACEKAFLSISKP